MFRSVTDLKQYDKEKKTYPQRSRGTVDLFPEINTDALRYIHSMLSVELRGETDRYDCDLTKEQEDKLRKWLKQENFPRLYAFANELLQPIPARLLQITEGQWVKYPQGGDPFDLFESIRGRGTGWCTIGAKNAQSELAQGDFHCYYSLDEDGNPAIPRIAIRMRGSQIFELRGIVGGQNIDPYMDDVLAKKLIEFPDRDKFFKRRADMKRLTEIERKVKKDDDLDPSDLLFLYEVDEPIESFGIHRDPRIKELRDSRDPQKDLTYAFSGMGEIAYNPSDINADTRVYVGPLTPEVFKAGQVEYIYTTFPGNCLKKEEVSIEGTLKTMQEELRGKGVWMKRETRSLLGNIVFGQNPREIDIFWLVPSDLGFDGPALIIDLIRRAKEVGLALPPAQAALSLRLAHLDQPEDQRLLVGSEPIIDLENEEDPYIFALLNNTLDGLLVDRVCVWDETNQADRIAFSTLPGQS